MAFVSQHAMNPSDMSVVLDGQYFKEEPCFSEDEFGFDFPDDLSVRSDAIFNTISTSSDSSVKEEEEPDDKVKVVKAATRKRGSKFMRKAAASYPVKLALQPKATYTGVRTMQPNMSRRTRDAALYVFPSFDRCDSLLFFPSTMARHMNSGDIAAVAKLFVTHFDKRCTIVGKKAPNSGLNIDHLTQKMKLMEEMQPDRITCFRHTQVDGNTIKAIGYMKFTKCRAIYESVARMVKGTSADHCFKHTWEEHMRHKLETEDRPQEEKERYLALVESGCDLVVYSRMEIVLKIDDMSKKVIFFDVSITTTSMEKANYETPSVVE